MVLHLEGHPRRHLHRRLGLDGHVREAIRETALASSGCGIGEVVDRVAEAQRVQLAAVVHGGHEG